MFRAINIGYRIYYSPNLITKEMEAKRKWITCSKGHC
jgi:hypothetical protein